jgi:hypothetical protein
MPIVIENIPLVLRGPRQWVLWRPEVRDNKPTKVPITAMGYHAKVNDPNTWSRLDYLLGLLRQRPDFAAGIGFVVTSEDSFCALDLDDCLTDSGAVKPWAQALLQQFRDCYCEITPSGGGLRIWCLARTPRGLRRSLPDGMLEVYSSSRYFTFTGHRFNNAPLQLAGHQADVDAIFEYYSPAAAGGSGDHGTTSAETIPAKIPNGQRYPTFISLAGTLVNRGVCDEAIEAVILSVNTHQCEEPKSDAEIRIDIQKILSSASGWRG